MGFVTPIDMQGKMAKQVVVATQSLVASRASGNTEPSATQSLVQRKAFCYPHGRCDIHEHQERVLSGCWRGSQGIRLLPTHFSDDERPCCPSGIPGCKDGCGQIQSSLWVDCERWPSEDAGDHASGCPRPVGATSSAGQMSICTCPTVGRRWVLQAS